MIMVCLHVCDQQHIITLFVVPVSRFHPESE